MVVALRIGIISDTHGSLPASVHQAFDGCGHILHAGDIGSQAVLDELEAIAPLTAVLGNCDRSGYRTLAGSVKGMERFDLDGLRFLMMHRPEDLAAHYRGLLMARQMPRAKAPVPLPQVCVHGHTHVRASRTENSCLIICPGSATRPRDRLAAAVAILTVENAKVSDLQFVELGKFCQIV
ncbi:MAG: YfcE family phosphodiesterase [Actinomycetia bacterium]|nr:YfcE family phosphodiesterase [Actinomycetes bacterium]